MVADMHTMKLEFLENNGFSYEYPGFFLCPINDKIDMTCAFDWNGTGKWEAQVVCNDGGMTENDYGKDLDTAEEVVKYRDELVSKQAELV